MATKPTPEQKLMKAELREMRSRRKKVIRDLKEERKRVERETKKLSKREATATANCNRAVFEIDKRIGILEGRLGA